MSALRIRIAGREYEIACDDGQESHLRRLAETFDQRIQGLGAATGKTNELQLMMLAGLMLTDELADAKHDLEHARYDIQHNSQSFEINKQIELENAVANTICDIASRIEAIAGELEKV
jgi:cell division protein ZapA